MFVNDKPYRTIWMEDGVVKMINQPLLPHQFEIIAYPTCAGTCEAIRSMVVRGAGAIGAAAGYAMAQAVREVQVSPEPVQAMKLLTTMILQTRPTAHNLFYAVGRVNAALEGIQDPAKWIVVADHVAKQIADEDVEDGQAIGKVGAALITDHMRILTHCNAGWLAFVDWGSALAPIYTAKREGKNLFVWVDETRPRLQGARLTSWELMNEGVPHAIIADNAAGYFMQRGEVDLVIVGADKVARNGDTANKIGTFEKALLANYFHIPFYVAIPPSTVDLTCADGSQITIEERDQDEVLMIYGKTEDGSFTSVQVSHDGAMARNPAFDITPAALITGFITPKGIIPPEQLKYTY